MSKTENRREKFIRLATLRTSATLDKLRLIGNLSNKSNYDYSEEDIKKIFSALEEQLRIIKHKFYLKPKKDFRL